MSTESSCTPPRDVVSKRRARHRGRPARRASLSSLGGDEAIRLCEVCRERQPRQELVQLSAQLGSGRHAYVCIRRACLKKAVSDTTTLQTEARRRIGEMAGLARRAGYVAFGAGALAREAATEGSTVLVACDAATRTVRAIGEVGVPVPQTSEELGHAVGHRPLAAVMVRPGRHAAQAAYWQRVWYEAREPETRVGRSATQPLKG